MTAQDYMTEAEAAQHIGVAARTLRAIRSRGEIRYVRPSPRKIYYRLEHVQEYLARHTMQDDPPCPSINPRKVPSSSSTSSGKGGGIMDRLASRPGGMPKGLKLISGGKSR